MDIKYSESIMQEMVEAEIIKEGLQDVASGRIVDGETVLNELKNKYL